jgi:hypothetical protein
MLERIDRLLFAPWTQRASVACFLAGAISFLAGWVTHTLHHADLWGIIGVILMVVGSVAWAATRMRISATKEPGVDAPVHPQSTGISASGSGEIRDNYIVGFDKAIDADGDWNIEGNIGLGQRSPDADD